MPNCPHGKYYEHENECLLCDELRQKRERDQIAQDVAYETLDVNVKAAEEQRKATEIQKQILAAMQQSKLNISSLPPGADIEIDGAFVGNTPSTIGVSSGSHVVRICKGGYIPSQRTILVSSGDVSVTAELKIMSPEHLAQQRETELAEKRQQEREQARLKESQRRAREQEERARERAEREKKQQLVREQANQTDAGLTELKRWANEQVEWAKKTREAHEQAELAEKERRAAERPQESYHKKYGIFIPVLILVVIVIVIVIVIAAKT